MANANERPHYTVIIQWSDEDQCYVVSLPEWGSGAKTHGATYEQAARNAHDVLEMLMEDDGTKHPDPQLFSYPGAVAVNLPEEPDEGQIASAVPAQTKQSA